MGFQIPLCVPLLLLLLNGGLVKGHSEGPLYTFGSGDTKNPRINDPSCLKDTYAKSKCGIIKDRNGPFTFCHVSVNPQAYFDDCVYDVCISNNKHDALCQSIQAYVSACQYVGAKIKSWRETTSCNMPCPKNSHYELCGTDCERTNSNLTVCQKKCTEGCFCDEGFKKTGGNCVQDPSRGCSYNGTHLQIGEEFWKQGCTKHCKCMAFNKIKCSVTSCKCNEDCVVQNGLSYCFPNPCKVQGDPPAECGCQQDGHFRKHGESFWSNSECKNKCVCDGKTGSIKCSLSSCKEDEICNAKNGEYGCHPNPCKVQGDPPAECGCQHDGRFRKHGESFWSDTECKNHCVCDGKTGFIKCSLSSCKDDEICNAENGEYGCHPNPCKVQGDPPAQCGCQHEGRFRKHGEIFWSDSECKNKCVCDGKTGSIRCRHSCCKEDEICNAENGQYGCHPNPCKVQGDPPAECGCQQDGRFWKHGESFWSDSECKNHCVCDGKTGFINCSLSSCKEDEICNAENGEYGCHPNPCKVQGDPPAECGCQHGGRFWKHGESFWSDSECKNKCVCDGKTGFIHCRLSSCKDDEICNAENGQYGCHPNPCKVQGDPPAECGCQQDGRFRKHGESFWSDSECKNHCVCDGKTGFINCSLSSCKDDEICNAENGEYGCHPNPCKVQGDPPAECGCQQDGRFWKHGEIFWSDSECKNKCVCDGKTGSIKCRHSCCKEDEICSPENGEYGCHPNPCKVQGDPPAECGCQQDGRFWKHGESFWSDSECKNHCVCDGKTGFINCSLSSCKEDEICNAENGQYGCHPNPCKVQGDPPAECGCQHDGRFWKHGEIFWSDSECKNKCVCDGKTGFIHCRLSSCKDDEICNAENGEYGCHPNPCKVQGDPPAECGCQQDGRFRKHGESFWSDSECKNHCVCDGKTGFINCSLSSCKEDEICSAENGQYGCQPNPCKVQGDPPAECGCQQDGRFWKHGEIFWSDAECKNKCVCDGKTGSIKCRHSCCKEDEICSPENGEYGCHPNPCKVQGDPPAECGCQQDGRFWKHGESFWSDSECKNHCVCDGKTGFINCSLSSCKEDEICNAENGQYGCHPNPCKVQGDPPAECGCQHDGRFWKHGEIFWSDSECKNKCVCDGKTGFIHCRLSSCKDDEICNAENGEYGCHPNPCKVQGDPPAECGCQQDGRFRKHGESFWSDSECKNHCVCDGKTGFINCSLSSCKEDEICSAENGQYGCQPNPCKVQGDPPAECGCQQDGRFWKHGEIFWSDAECKNKCVCDGKTGSIKCRHSCCKEDEICSPENGQYGCHPNPCKVQGDPPAECGCQQDGRFWKHGESFWSDTECKNHCVCNGKTGFINCSLSSCKDDEICNAENGEYGCHPNPCKVQGDPPAECGCQHDGRFWKHGESFWSDTECKNHCVCDGKTGFINCSLSSCKDNEICNAENGEYCCHPNPCKVQGDPPAECGCQHDGRFWKHGEIFWSDSECKNKCVCDGKTGSIKCTHSFCKEDEICSAENGQYSCHPNPCKVQGDPPAECGCQQDGRFWKHGEGFWSDTECKNHCVCNGKTGFINCSLSSCKDDEICNAENGEYGCHPNPCKVQGDPPAECGCQHDGRFWKHGEIFWSDSECKNKCVCDGKTGSIKCTHSCCKEDEICSAENGQYSCNPNPCKVQGDPPAECGCQHDGRFWKHGESFWSDTECKNHCVCDGKTGFINCSLSSCKDDEICSAENGQYGCHPNPCKVQGDPPAECGCQHDGRFWKHGEIFFSDSECKNKCVCDGKTGSIKCTHSCCKEDEICSAENGQYGCHPNPCNVQGDPPAECGCQQDGRFRKHGESFWSDTECKNHCVCNGKTGFINCSLSSCKDDEICNAENGQYGCHPNPCKVQGDPPAECGCQQDGRFRKHGEIFWSDSECKNKCVCDGKTGSIKCRHSCCKEDEICNAENGQFGCHPNPCKVQGDPPAECGCQQDRRFWKHGESFWTDTECKTKCVCDGKTGFINCSLSSCKEDEICSAENGQYGCHPNPCKVQGDPPAQCGCQQDGRFRKHGESFWSDSECKNKCVCDGKTGSIKCTHSCCKEDEICSAENGQYGCNPNPCKVQGDPPAECGCQQDGRFRKHGESFWSDSKCKNHCVCNGKTGFINCSLSSCKDDDICSAENGQYGCHPNPCKVQGDPPAECGCQHDGRFRKHGESFWSDSKCKNKCVCDGKTGSINCSPSTCKDDETCRVVGGERGCHPRLHATCYASGDPHYTTFDGQRFDFQGTCRYILAKLCDDSLDLPYFEIIGQNKAWNGLPVSITVGVSVNISGHLIHISQSMYGTAEIDGVTTNLPVLLDFGSISVYSNGPNTFINTDFGLVVTYDGSSSVTITVPGNFSGATCGLCGNFNGDNSDDFRTQSGALTSSVSEFGTDWKVGNDPTCEDGCGDSCPSCPDDTKAKSMCDIISDTNGPFTFCHASVNPQAFFNDCVYDVCISNINHDSLCQSIQAYVSACQYVGATIKSWRETTSCNMSCPKNSHYELCGTDCGRTNSNHKTCHNKCTEGCFCDDGFNRTGGNCVQGPSSGCSYNGNTLLIGEEFWKHGCSEHCTCSAFNNIHCIPSSCKSNEDCVVQNGQPGCHPNPCKVEGDPPAECGCQQDGRFRKHGESFWSDSECKNHCVCDGKTGFINCSLSSCKDDEICNAENGEYGCHPNPCKVQGDPPAECGCQQDGRFRKHGESFWSDSKCKNKCVCDGKTGFINCSLSSCKDDEICNAENGEYGCHPNPCKVQGYPPAQCGCQQDGRFWKHGEIFWSDSECKNKCVCDGKTGSIKCRHSCCKEDEICSAENGQYGCHPNPCKVQGDPPAQCGCQHDGRFRKHGESFWSDSKCKNKCVCDGKTGSINCSPSTCKDDETCRVVGGERGCHPRLHATCYASGDPHYTTFDGQRFDFQGTCRYILAKLCDDSLDLPYFEVIGQNKAWNGLPVSITVGVSVNISGHLIHISQSMYGTAEIDGVTTNLPVLLDFGSISVYSNGPNTFINTDFGLVVTYDGSSSVTITVPGNFSGATCGLCGNFNGDNSDDFRTHSGALTSSVSEFGTDWKVGNDPTCEDGCGDSCPSCADDTKAKSMCDIISDTNGPFTFCHASVNPQAFFNDCVYDVCISNNNHDALCQSIQAYVSACQYVGATIKPWRETTSCNMSCPKNSHYELCGTDCGRTNSNHKICHNKCTEGCFCDDSFNRTGGNCVQGVCSYNGNTLQIGEEFWNHGCSEHCTCSAFNNIHCIPSSCKSNEDCVVQNGQPGCHPNPCKVQGDPPAECGCQQDGRFWKHGESFWSDSECKNHCVCNGKTGFMNCSLSPCKDDEICSAKNGEYGCHPNPCKVQGDPPAECGCQHDGRFWKHGEIFWSDSECKNKCVCDGKTGSIKCRHSCCKEDEICSAENGQYGCHPNPCKVQGDPPAQCGCQHDGRFRKHGESFWSDSKCKNKCVCDGKTGSINCSPSTCKDDETCRVVGGERGCHPRLHATCYASGDPHYTTFDGQRFDFQGTCRYILAKLCDDSLDLPYFEVIGQNKAWNGLPVSITVGVSVNISGHLIHISQSMYGTAEIDGVTTNLPVLLDFGSISVYSNGPNTFINTDFGLVVTYDGSSSVTITVPGNFSGATCGLCGNFNGDNSDDFRTHSGALTSSVSEFGTDWKVGNDPTCEDGCGDSCPSCADDTKAKSMCDIISDTNGPFTFCHASVNPQAFFNDCVYDVCISNNNHDALCQSIQAYVSACQYVGATIKPWRETTSCNMSCPKNSHYELCGTDCGRTNSNHKICHNKCTEGCFCDDSFNRTGGNCVQGVCSYNGNTLQIGEEFWNHGCSEHCTCSAFNNIHCIPSSCKSNEDCVVQNGQPGCHPNPCKVQGDPPAECGCQQDGRFWKHGESFWSDSECKNHCVCDGKTGFINCSLSPCKDDEICSAKNGEYGCHPNPCKVQGDPPAECGCQHDGRFWKHGEIFWSDSECKNKCVCDGKTGSIKCRHSCCKEDEICSAENGQYGCHPNPCKVQGDPPAQCGCQHDGRFRKHGESFWSDSKCKNKCVCDGKTGSINCSPSTCKDDETCRVVGGERGCHPRLHATCYASGDPHYTTFDGQRFDFQGTCRYILAKLCDDSLDLPYFEVIGQNKAWNELPVSITVGVSVNISGHLIHISQSMYGTAEIDGVTTNLPVLLDFGSISVYSNGPNTFINTDFGLVVTYDGSSSVTITVPGNFSGATCGLCGNFNGDNSDDFRTHSGALTSSVSEFGTDWKVGNDPTCEDGCGDSCPSCADDTKAKSMCDIISDTNGPFTFCHASVNPQAFFNDCVYDVCISNNNHDALCQSIQAYVSACQYVGATIKPWRETTSCNMSCPKNSHYELCGTDCGRTNSNHKICHNKCTEGCFCDDSFNRTGGNCVQGVCSYNGNTLQIGEEFWNHGCSEHCTCSAFNNIHCIPSSCKSNEDCVVQNGQPGCHPNPCKVQGDPPAECGCQQDGRFWKHGESFWSDSECKNHCVCDGKTGFINCSLSSCKDDEICSAENGEYGCHPNPCKVQGDPPAECGCQHGGRFWKHGEIFWSDSECKNKCVCDGKTGSIKCRHSCCKEDEICSAENGQYGCHPNPCKVQGDPPAQCGCQHDGRFRKHGESFWSDSKCKNKCVCDGKTGSINCSPSTCKDDETCRVVGGERGCHPRLHATCYASGDPHYTTFDGQRFDFQGTCRYLLAKLCDDSLDLPYFEVIGQNKAWNGLPVSITVGVSVNISGHLIHISQSMYGTAEIDGVTTNLPVLLDFGSISVYSNGPNTFINTDFGLVVTYDGSSSVTITVPGNFSGATCGLCGNFNGDNSDDFRTHSGALTSSVSEFGTDWKVGNDPTCEDGCGDSCPSCADDTKAKSMCDIISDTNGPFTFCHASVNPQAFFNDCVYDVCISNNNHDALCQSIQAYVSACQYMGATIKPWRETTSCNMSCPKNSHYELCGTDCGRTNSNHKICHNKCTEGCFCDDSFNRTGGNCVQGVCSYNGNTLLIGEEFWNHGCSEHCTCSAFNNIHCIPSSCKSNEDCVVQNGQPGCHPNPCKVQGDPPAECGCQQDGRFRKHGESFWSDSECKNHCVCDGKTGFINCSLSSCKDDEICNAENGEYGCHPNPCKVQGDPPAECGCQHNGRFWKHGEIFWSDSECKNKCVCDGKTGSIKCRHSCCKEDEICSAENGQYGCHPNPCKVQGDLPAQCGCQHDGRFRKHGESFWSDTECKNHCVCDGKTGSINCSPSTCKDDETCHVVGGERGCHPRLHATCYASGDPHYTTFDGQRFDFQGTCRYILAKLCDDSLDLPYFEVIGQNKAWNGLPVSITVGVSVNISGHLIHISQSMYGTAEIDGVTTNLPVLLDFGSISVYSNGPNTFINTDFGLVVTYDGSSSVTITVPGNFSGATCGLCGNFNGDNSDDFRTQSGALTSSVSEFGTDWKVGNDPTCEDGCGDSCPSCPDDTKAKSMCDIISDTNGPFTFCHASVNPQAFFNDCVYDVCISNNNHDSLCQSIQAYVSACQYVGATIKSWRETTSCNMSCPKNSHYELCGTDCGRTNSNHKICHNKCTEGCFCDDGFNRTGGNCVQGVCSYNENTLQIGEEFWKHGCSEHCTCSVFNNIHCIPSSCKSNEDCVVQNGQPGCHPNPCKVEGDPPGHCGCQHEGRFRKHGESFWSDSECKNHCVCDGKTGFINCSPSTCKDDEICNAEDGQYGCHPNSCKVQGDPPAECGCQHDGRFRKHGESFWSDTKCKNHCVCDGKTGFINCSLSSCKDDQICSAENGGYGCHPNPCKVQGDPPAQCGCQHDGRFRKHGESFWSDEKCKNHCVCDGKTGYINCSLSSCKDDETCRVVGGERGCHPRLHATFYVSGDPHYTTFDGQRFDFQGTCRYILAKLCDDSLDLPYFEVIGQNKAWNGLPVSITVGVSVNISGHLIHISQNMYGTAEIDGVLTNLPVLLDFGSISVYSNGPNTFINTDFGLVVTYDGSSLVTITVPGNFSGATCGLCGNFNGDNSDDFRTQSGALTSSVSEFGADWKVGNDPTCDDGCGDSCPSCPDDTKAKSMCDIISDTNGPFTVCHASVNPQAFFDDCVYDVCISNNNHDTLCQSIQAYVSACQYVGATIKPWRETTSCNMSCPKNSHYELCGTDCGRTNSNHKICHNKCTEGCFCDDSFNRTGGNCVQGPSSGCSYNGNTLLIGEQFWTDGCTRQCKCFSPNDIRCNPASCNPNEECLVQNGELGCYSQMTSCMVSGDPHYFTFDGNVVHFQGTCSYEISHTCGNINGNNLQFRVVATNMHRGSRTVSFVSAMDVWLTQNGQQTHISIGKNRNIEVDGKTVKSLPCRISNLFEIYQEQNFVVVNASSELMVYFDGSMTLVVRLGPRFRGSVCGMCGNNNGDPTDDKNMLGGAPAPDDTALGKSWKSDTSHKGCGANDQMPDPNDCPNKHKYSELCSIITNTSGPFWHCHVHINPEHYFTSCVYDMCSYSCRNMFHSAVKAYEIACTMIGLQIPDWSVDLSCLRDPCKDLRCTEDEWCGEKNGIYGCFCDENHPRQNPDYYDAKEVCEISFGTISLSRCQLFEAGFYAQNLHLSDPTCKGQVQDGRLVFNFDNENHMCGTNITANGTHLIYNNVIRGGARSTSPIIRNKQLDLYFSCVYDLTQTISMDTDILTIQSVVHKTHPNGKGTYKVKIIPYLDAGFIHPYTGTGHVEVDYRVYVAVLVEGVNNNLIATVIDSCWATPENDENSDRWDLIINRCPSPEDNTVEMIENGVSTTGRFSFKTFAFKEGCSKIFIHCHIHLCLQKSNNCAVNCHPRHPHRPCRSVDIHDSTSISMGPFIRTSEVTGE